MVERSLAGDFASARPLHYQLLEFIQACFKDGSPSGVKSIMAAQGRIQNVLRLPLVPVNEEVERQIVESVRKCKFM
jgi:4-hydroxy-tetrahydrodipicolinate synthase